MRYEDDLIAVICFGLIVLYYHGLDILFDLMCLWAHLFGLIYSKFTRSTWTKDGPTWIWVIKTLMRFHYKRHLGAEICLRKKTLGLDPIGPK